MNDFNHHFSGLLKEMLVAYADKQKQQESVPLTVHDITANLHPVLASMCEFAENHQASDIFISVGFPPAMKINSVLTPTNLPVVTPDKAIEIVASTMTPAQRQKFNDEMELNYSLQSKSKTRYRVNAYHDQGHVGVVLRRINTKIPTVEELALPPKLNELILQPRGLLILAGATGSGKSTTMAAMMGYRNKTLPGHIVTIEDPIEYIHVPQRSIITQREVGMDTPSWSIAVQSAMRQAPDVVSIGEVRSLESMEHALELAQTGHLCIFTIHATNANQAVERIINLYDEDRHKQVLMDLALNLVGIIGQRLVRKIEGGRTAIVDLLINNPAMQDLIYKGELMSMKELMTRSQGDGMQTFDQHLFDLYTAGIIDKDEALRQADSINDVRLRIQLYEDGGNAEKMFDRTSNLNII